MRWRVAGPLLPQASSAQGNFCSSFPHFPHPGLSPQWPVPLRAQQELPECKCGCRPNGSLHGHLTLGQAGTHLGGLILLPRWANVGHIGSGVCALVPACIIVLGDWEHAGASDSLTVPQGQC